MASNNLIDKLYILKAHINVFDYTTEWSEKLNTLVKNIQESVDEMFANGKTVPDITDLIDYHLKIQTMIKTVVFSTNNNDHSDDLRQAHIKTLTDHMLNCLQTVDLLINCV